MHPLNWAVVIAYLLYVVIDGKKLTAEFIDEDGKVEFAHAITKP